MNKQIKTAAIFLTVICAVVVGCHKVPQKQPADKTSSIASNEEYTSISLLPIFPQKTSSDIVGRGLMRHNKELVNKYQVRVFFSHFFVCLLVYFRFGFSIPWSWIYFSSVSMSAPPVVVIK